MTAPFVDKIAGVGFALTCEITPPRGPVLEKMICDIDTLKGRVDAILVADNRRNAPSFPAAGAALLIKERGSEPILCVSCRDRNRLAVQSDLMFAASRGIKNIFCVSGDSIQFSNGRNSKQVHDLDSVQLLHVIRDMADGKDSENNPMNRPMVFFAGASAAPDATPLEPQLIKLEKKIEAGAAFFITRPVFDLNRFLEFVEKTRKMNMKIIAGVRLLSSVRAAKQISARPGLYVPSVLIDEMAEAGGGRDELKKGIEIAARIIRTLRDKSLCAGVHVSAPEMEETIPEILVEAGL